MPSSPYRLVLRKKYFAHAKSKKRTEKQNRAIVYSMLNAVKRNLEFVDDLMGKCEILGEKDAELLATIRKLYARQKEMFYEHKHCIVNITQPFARPTVRGKAKATVEFGAKYDVSINERGHARFEKVTFYPYNEGAILCDVVEYYRERTGFAGAHFGKQDLLHKNE